ncbi:hypothetical protein BKA93DRAFT_754696 [Sparassis latifolia]
MMMGPLLRHTPMVVGLLLIHLGPLLRQICSGIGQPSDLWRWANCWRKHVLVMTYPMSACSKTLTEGALAMGRLLAITCSGNRQPSNLWRWAHRSSYTLGDGPTAHSSYSGGGHIAQRNMLWRWPTLRPLAVGPLLIDHTLAVGPLMVWAEHWEKNTSSGPTAGIPHMKDMGPLLVEVNMHPLGAVKDLKKLPDTKRKRQPAHPEPDGEDSSGEDNSPPRKHGRGTRDELVVASLRKKNARAEDLDDGNKPPTK